MTLKNYRVGHFHSKIKRGVHATDGPGSFKIRANLKSKHLISQHPIDGKVIGLISPPGNLSSNYRISFPHFGRLFQMRLYI